MFCSKTLQEVRVLPSLTPAIKELNVAGAQRAAQLVTAASAWLVSRGAPKTTGVGLEGTGYLGTTATNLQTEYQQCYPHQALVRHGAMDRVMMPFTARNDKIMIVQRWKILLFVQVRYRNKRIEMANTLFIFCLILFRIFQQY